MWMRRQTVRLTLEAKKREMLRVGEPGFRIELKKEGETQL